MCLSLTRTGSPSCPNLEEAGLSLGREEQLSPHRIRPERCLGHGFHFPSVFLLSPKHVVFFPAGDQIPAPALALALPVPHVQNVLVFNVLLCSPILLSPPSGSLPRCLQSLGPPRTALGFFVRGHSAAARWDQQVPTGRNAAECSRGPQHRLTSGMWPNEGELLLEPGSVQSPLPPRTYPRQVEAGSGSGEGGGGGGQQRGPGRGPSSSGH